MGETIFKFSDLSKLLLEHSEVVEEALKAFREERGKILGEITERLVRERIRYRTESGGALTGFAGGLLIDIQPGTSVYISLDAATLKKMNIEIGVRKGRRREMRYSVSIEDKTLEQIGEEVSKKVKELRELEQRQA